MILIHIKSLRPLHWLKNLLVLAPVFFSGNAGDLGMILRELAAFAGFCAAAGHVYVVNDLADAGSDAADAVRRGRPFASGSISRNSMVVLAAAAAGAAAAVSVIAGAKYLAVVAAYVGLMYLYTFFLKRFGAAGVFAIAAGMLLRILAGAVAIGVPVSPWVYPCAFLLAFYVVTGKRIYDAGGEGGPEKIDVILFVISGALTGIGYLVYSFSGAGPEKYHTSHLWATAPFVLAAIGRYYMLMTSPRPGVREKEHLHATLTDWVLIGICVAWGAVFAAMIYFL